jgi:hypothetical protein
VLFELLSIQIKARFLIWGLMFHEMAKVEEVFLICLLLARSDMFPLADEILRSECHRCESFVLILQRKTFMKLALSLKSACPYMGDIFATKKNEPKTKQKRRTNEEQL